MSFSYTVAEPEGAAAAAAQADRAESSRGAFTQGGRRRARPSRDSPRPGSTSVPSPPTPAAPGHLTQIGRAHV